MFTDTGSEARCELCGRRGRGLLERVDVNDFHGNFCPVCRSMLEQTTRDDGSSRLHPSHINMIHRECPKGQIQMAIVDHMLEGQINYDESY